MSGGLRLRLSGAPRREVRGVVAPAVLLAAAVLVAAPDARHDLVQSPAQLPSALKLVDRSRLIRLPDGQRVPRPVTTELFYPASPAPWPLVVFGHGFALTPLRYARLLRAWATAGYLVAAPVFPLTNAHAPGGPNESDLFNQPADISFVISQLLRANAARGNPLFGLIEATRIAVAGQSDGAMTAFAAAYERRWHDGRIRAALILSGAELGGATQRLAPKGPPLLAVQGTNDDVNNPVNARTLFNAVSRPKFLLLLHGSGHLDPYTRPGRALHAVERVTIAFLDRYLRGGPPQRLAHAADGTAPASLKSEP